MPQTDPVLIFDLDGTILRTNSFPIWALMMLLGQAPHLRRRERLALSLRVQRLLVRRRLRGYSHAVLMRDLQSIWRDAIASDGDGHMAARLQATLIRLVRPALEPVLQAVARGEHDAVLATAAAGEYAEPLGKALGFSAILATPALRDGIYTANNTGERKREAVLAWLAHRGWTDRLRIFFNDEMADLPLMKESHAVCWFGRDRDLARLRAAAPGVRIVPCRNLRANELRATLAHLSQSLAAGQLAGIPTASVTGPGRVRISL